MAKYRSIKYKNKIQLTDMRDCKDYGYSQNQYSNIGRRMMHLSTSSDLTKIIFENLVNVIKRGGSFENFIHDYKEEIVKYKQNNFGETNIETIFERNDTLDEHNIWNQKHPKLALRSNLGISVLVLGLYYVNKTGECFDYCHIYRGQGLDIGKDLDPADVKQTADEYHDNIKLFIKTVFNYYYTSNYFPRACYEPHRLEFIFSLLLEYFIYVHDRESAEFLIRNVLIFTKTRIDKVYNDSHAEEKPGWNPVYSIAYSENPITILYLFNIYGTTKKYKRELINKGILSHLIRTNITYYTIMETEYPEELKECEQLFNEMKTTNTPDFATFIVNSKITSRKLDPIQLMWLNNNKQLLMSRIDDFYTIIKADVCTRKLILLFAESLNTDYEEKLFELLGYYLNHSKHRTEGLVRMMDNLLTIMLNMANNIITKKEALMKLNNYVDDKRKPIITACLLNS